MFTKGQKHQDESICHLIHRPRNPQLRASSQKANYCSFLCSSELGVPQMISRTVRGQGQEGPVVRHQGPDRCGQALLQIGINMMALPGGRHLDSIPLPGQRNCCLDLSLYAVVKTLNSGLSTSLEDQGFISEREWAEDELPGQQETVAAMALACLYFLLDLFAFGSGTSVLWKVLVTAMALLGLNHGVQRRRSVCRPLSAQSQDWPSTIRVTFVFFRDA
ncbi:Protein inscuteable like protein [Tupaia chinensis]|uniref:Protein inscuteable like protein n=1 Tax=Tupaia chinensis TaxID=246437 RepID=L9L7Y8_TUPCH|nr:Protein inscuteable like protein [Tupaia chinensis]